MTMRLCALALSILAAAPNSAMSQQGPDTFEVASVKVNGTTLTGFGFDSRGGKISFTNVELREIIAQAFGFGFGPASPIFQGESKIVGGNAKLLATRFDLTAKVPAGSKRDRLEPMLQNLLAERFGLRAHFEKRPGSVYELTVSRKDGALGPLLKASKFDCLAYIRQGGKIDAPDTPRDANGRSWCWPPVQARAEGERGAKVLIRAGAISQLIASIQPFVDRPIVDTTALQGNFEWQLTFAAVQKPDGDTPSIFTALPEQLGLKLAPHDGPTEVLVIDALMTLTPD